LRTSTNELLLRLVFVDLREERWSASHHIQDADAQHDSSKIRKVTDGEEAGGGATGQDKL